MDIKVKKKIDVQRAMYRETGGNIQEIEERRRKEGRRGTRIKEKMRIYKWRRNEKMKNGGNDREENSCKGEER